MGKAGRFACIIVPYALTIASLVCIVLLAMGCTDHSSSTLNSIYLFRVDMQNLTTSKDTATELSNLLKEAGLDDQNQNLTKLLDEAKKELKLKDFYTVGLLGYCDGDVSGSHSDSFDTTFCSKPKAEFWFNPVEVWGLDNVTGTNDTQLENLLPGNIQKELNAYRTASKYMFVAFCIAFAATILELLVGIAAIWSRWGSCVTYLLGGVSSLFLISAVVVSTVLSAIVTSAIRKNLKSYGITAEFGRHFQAVAWLAVAFHVAASLFWMISACCCSGRSSPHRITAEKAPYTYESLGPHDGTSRGNNVPMHNMRNSAYEPYRHV